MRDDVKNLFSELHNLTSKKLEALQEISSAEAQKKFCLDTGKIDDLLGLFEKDSDSINNINSLDYEIKKIEGEICGIIGIPGGEFPGFITKIKEKPIADLKNKIYDINKLLKNLIKSREELAERMDLKLNDIDKDIKSICQVRKLKKALRQFD